MKTSSSLDIDEGIKEYFKTLKNFKPLKKKDEQVLLKEYLVNGNINARNVLIQSNLKYACSIANSYRGRGVDFSELISEANNGLIEGIEKFDMSKDVKVITYAKWWIIQRLNAYLNNKNKIKTDELPTEHEEQVYNDDGVSEKVEKEHSENYIVNDIDFEKNNNETKERVNILLSTLNERERDIVSLYYGLYGDYYNLDDIGESYNLTKERVRQIIETSFKKIRTQALVKNI